MKEIPCAFITCLHCKSLPYATEKSESHSHAQTHLYMCIWINFLYIFEFCFCSICTCIRIRTYGFLALVEVLYSETIWRKFFPQYLYRAWYDSDWNFVKITILGDHIRSLSYQVLFIQLKDTQNALFSISSSTCIKLHEIYYFAYRIW